MAYITLKDINLNMLQAISDDEMIPVKIHEVNNDRVIEEDDLMEFIEGMQQKYEELYTVHKEYEQEVQMHWIKDLKTYE